MTTHLNETEENVDVSGIKDLPVTLENPGFAADEMTPCGKCGRSNPPNRSKCFYCGSDLSVAEKYTESIRPALRKLEEWEKGFNVILFKRSETLAELRQIAGEIGLELDQLKKITEMGASLPLARVESEQEAALIQNRVSKYGFECRIVSDEELDMARPPRRLRGLVFTNAGLIVTDFNSGERTMIAADDLALIVTGKLFELRTHSFEKRKKGKSKVIDQSDSSSDEAVIDIYDRKSNVGFRIYESGFDFSCLGKEKGLLAADNFPKLLQKLREASPAAKVVDNYRSIRDALEAVWELTLHKDFEGLRRSGFGKADFGKAVTVSNHAQFNRFSRMQRQLL